MTISLTSARRRDHITLRGILRPALGIVVVVVLFPYVWVLLQPSVESFSPDSWSYYDLSQTIFGDFYHPSATRSYVERNGFSRSFPPLWPVVIRLVDGIFQRGPATAASLAALAALMTLVPLHLIAAACLRRRGMANIAAVVTWLSLLLFLPYWDEVLGGRSIPIAILLLLSGVACLVGGSRDRSWAAGFTAGVFFGGACLARFDSLVFCAVAIAIALTAQVRRASFKASIIIAFCTTVMPWVIYSERRYNTIWASDNSFVALSADTTYVQNYRRPAATIFTNPLKWAKRIAGNGADFVREAGDSSGAFFPLSPLLLAAAYVVAQLAETVRKRGRSELKQLLFFVVAALIGLAGQLLTGYLDRRYFSTLCTLATCWMICAALSYRPTIRVAVPLFLTLMLLRSPKALWWTAREWRRTPVSFSTLKRMAEVEGHPLRPGAVVLASARLGYKYGALTRQPTVCVPTDWEQLTYREREEFISAFHVTHVLLPTVSEGALAQRSVTDQLHIVPIQDGVEFLTSK